MPSSAAARVEAPLRRSAPATRARPRPARRPRKERRFATNVVWIGVVALLLGGVVFMNVAVLRLKVQSDKVGHERVSLLSKKAQLASQISSAASTARIQDAASRQLGLVPAAPDQTTYLHLKP